MPAQAQGCRLVLPAVGDGQGLPDHRRCGLHLRQPGAAVHLGQPDFQACLAEQTDYYKTFQTVSANDMKIQFTPQPLFFETTTEWAGALQDIYAGADAQARLDELVENLTYMLEDAGILD